MTVPGIMDTTGMILTTQPIEWTFGCNFESSYDIKADEMTMDSSARTGEFVDTGRFDLSLDFYRSDKYETTTDGSSQVGSAVNFGSKHFPLLIYFKQAQLTLGAPCSKAHTVFKIHFYSKILSQNATSPRMYPNHWCTVTGFTEL